MCFICRVLCAILLTRIVVRILLYGLGLALLIALTFPARALFFALRDGLADIGVVGPALAVLAAVLVGTGIVFGRRRAN